MSIAELFDLSPGEQYARAIARGEHRKPGFHVDVAVREWLGPGRETRALLSTDGSANEWTGSTGVPPPARRRRFVRDLLRVVPATERLSVIVKEVATGDLEGGASAVGEGEGKPEVEMQFDAEEILPKKVSAWVPATTELYEDAPGLAAYVDGRLAEMLGVREDAELLSGDGTGDHMLGFLEAGILSQTAVAGDAPGSIGAGIAKVEARSTIVDGIVVNSTDYWSARTGRHANPLDGVAFDDRGDIFGIPTARTTEMPAGHVLVGSFMTGAVLRERSGLRIRIGTEHDDYLIKNKLAVVAEFRENLGIHREDFFCDVALS